MSAAPKFDVLAVLAEIRDELRLLRSRVERGGCERPRRDDAAIAELLRAIVATIGCGNVFSVADLIGQARTQPGLRAALVSVVGEIDGSARRIGKLLSRSVGYAHAGLRVERAGIVREGRLWAVNQT